MKGTHRVIVHTKRLHYDFELKRNLTIIRGDSATGKTTLVDMIQEHAANPLNGPVTLSCDKPCFALSGPMWREQLSGMRDSIVFVDEGNEFVKSDEFARETQASDNYYVLISRESLPSLPYSVEEIYGIKTSGKYGTLSPSYHEFYRLYGEEMIKGKVKPKAILTEDRNAGYQFFQAVCRERQLSCDSAKGKSNIFQLLKNSDKKDLNARVKKSILAVMDQIVWD